MNKTFYYLFFIILLGLNSCSLSKESAFDTETGQNDYLVYIKDQELLFYDPANKVNTTILPEWDIDEFNLSSNNHLAFSTSSEDKSKIYVLDYPFNENTPTEITFFANAKISSISWSPNGHYLLFDSAQGESKKLRLWDGKNLSTIYNHHGKIGEITWSNNGTLAFTEYFINDPSPKNDPSEVYIWDGNAIVSVSQNPSGEDRFPAWSKDGQLAFLSNRDGEYDIFVWDGKSIVNDTPDINTFLNIASDLTQYYSKPVWTNSDMLTFSAKSVWDLYVQIYKWDGQSVRNISKNPFSHNGEQTWRKDGYWSFITFFSESQNLYIRDEKNKTILKTKGQYSPAWSQNGILIFCVPNGSSGWTLSMWNSEDVIEIAHGNFIEAKWNNGEYVFCSSG